MGISDNYLPVRLIGDGVTTQFSASWSLLNKNYIRVYLESVATGVQVLQVLDTDFALTFNAAGLVVDFSISSAPTAASYVIIARDITVDQTMPYKTSKGFQGYVQEDSFDKLTAISQDLKEEISRAPSSPIGSTGLVLPIYVDGAVPYWSPVADTQINSTKSMADIEGAVDAVAALTAASGAKVSANDTAVGFLNGKLVTGDSIEFTENNDGSNESLTIAVGDGSIGLDKMATGTTGNLITFAPTTGVAQPVATGDAGQVLTSNGVDLAPTMQDADELGWQTVEIQTVSGVPQVEFLTFEGPALYRVYGEKVSNVLGDRYLLVQFGDSGGYKTTNYDYGVDLKTVSGGYTGPAFSGGENSSRLLITWDGSTASSEPAAGAEIQFDFKLRNMAIASRLCTIEGSCFYGRTFDSSEMSFVEYFGRYNPASEETITKIRIAPESGNFSGTFTLKRLSLS